MSAPLTASPLDSRPWPGSPRRIAQLRAVAALLWAGAIAIVAGDAGSDLPAGVAALVAVYPLIDVVASLREATLGGDRVRRLQVNAAISLLAAAGLAVVAFGSDTRAVLAVFGAWASVSGAMQLANAIHRRRTGTRELPMLVSGAISTLAGISFIAASGMDDPTVTNLAGYAAFGALLYLLWAHRTRTSS
jgi:drug/metabolite transporter (DMT)-like permease